MYWEIVSNICKIKWKIKQRYHCWNSSQIITLAMRSTRIYHKKTPEIWQVTSNITYWNLNDAYECLISTFFLIILARWKQLMVDHLSSEVSSAQWSVLRHWHGSLDIFLSTFTAIITTCYYYYYYYIMILFKQLYWLSCCHLTFRKNWYCLIKTWVSLSFSIALCMTS